jgi:uracil-DNA glycosylase family 4
MIPKRFFMTDLHKEFLKIVADVRAHLEYQRALGVKLVEMPLCGSSPSETRPATATREGSAVTVPVASHRSVPERRPVATTASPVAAPSGSIEAPSSGPLTLEAIREEIGDCKRCKLHKGRKNIVFGEGDSKAVLVFVGEGPGFEEDQQGRPFVGAAGQLLTDIIVKGMKLRREDVYICNIVKCRPPENRNPELDEVEACIGFVKKQIAAIRPKVIVTLGNVPTQNLLGTKQGITRMRGTWQEYHGIPVMPTFHPSYLLRSPGEKKKVWEDIQLVMAKLGMAVPVNGSGARSLGSGERR